MLDSEVITLIDGSISLSKQNKKELYVFLQRNPEKTNEIIKILSQEDIINQDILKKYK